MPSTSHMCLNLVNARTTSRIRWEIQTDAAGSEQRRTGPEVRNPSPYDGQVAEARLGGKRLGPHIGWAPRVSASPQATTYLAKCTGKG